MFKSFTIVRAMQNIYGKKFDTAPKKLKEWRQKKGKSRAKILEEILYNKELGPLNKIALGEELAQIVVDEIDKVSIQNQKERKMTEPEEVIEKIIQLFKENE